MEERSAVQKCSHRQPKVTIRQNCQIRVNECNDTTSTIFHLRITPSMASGLSEHVWSLKGNLHMADNELQKPGKRRVTPCAQTKRLPK